MVLGLSILHGLSSLQLCKPDFKCMHTDRGYEHQVDSCVTMYLQYHQAQAKDIFSRPEVEWQLQKWHFLS